MDQRTRPLPLGAARWLALALAVLSVSVLIGWSAGIGPLKTILPGFTTMKANTAVAFGAMAIAIGFCSARLIGLRRVARAGATVALAIGAATFAEYLFRVDLGIDQWLFADADTTSRPFNGRMSPATALGFVAAGASLGLLASARSHRMIVIAQLLAVVPAVVGFLSLAGYAYGVENLYNFGPFVSVALHTGCGMIACAAAILLTRRQEGWGRAFLARPVAKRALIQIGTLALAIPFVTGLLVVRGLRAGYYEAAFTPTLFAVASAIALLWVAFRSAGILSVAELELQAARSANIDKGYELARTNDRHRRLVEGLPQLVWTARPDGYADYFSPQWIEYTGIDECLQLGEAWLELVIHPDDRDRTRDHWAGAVAGRHPYDVDYRILGATGTYRWFKVRGTPLPDEETGATSWFGSCTDIQDIVEAREVLARSRSDLEVQVASRTAELMAVEGQLRQSQKMEAVGQLTGGVAHDFNNLLTIIRSASDLLRRSDLTDDRRRRYLDSISDTADRAAKLTGQLLAFSRRQALKPEILDAAASVANVTDMLQSVVGARIAIIVEPSRTPCFMEADASQFETALVNMAVNARDAMAEEGTLTLRVEASAQVPPMRAHPSLPGPFVAISITDTGCGIPEDRIDQIFEPFFTTKDIGKGTGLGLSQVFGFAKQSGGDICVASKVGEGTTFTLYLPRADRAAEISLPTIATGIARIPEHGRGRRVLVVEDNADVGTFSTQLLQDLGYDTRWCGTGREALALLDSGASFDALFSDVVMPGMSGIELAHEVRSRYPQMPIVLTSGYSHVLAEEGSHGFELLSKPYAVEELSRILRRAMMAPVEPRQGERAG